MRPGRPRGGAPTGPAAGWARGLRGPGHHSSLVCVGPRAPARRFCDTGGARQEDSPTLAPVYGASSLPKSLCQDGLREAGGRSGIAGNRPVRPAPHPPGSGGSRSFAGRAACPKAMAGRTRTGTRPLGLSHCHPGPRDSEPDHGGAHLTLLCAVCTAPQARALGTGLSGPAMLATAGQHVPAAGPGASPVLPKAMGRGLSPGTSCRGRGPPTPRVPLPRP